MSVAEGGTDGTYTVYLDADPGTTFNVDLATASSEITISESQLVFTDLDYGTAQPVTVSAVDDSEVESLEEVIITHSVDIPGNFVWDGAFSPSGADLTARVYDNDEAGILVSSSTLYIDEDGSTTYDVKLMGSPSQDVTVRAADSTLCTRAEWVCLLGSMISIICRSLVLSFPVICKEARHWIVHMCNSQGICRKKTRTRHARRLTVSSPKHSSFLPVTVFFSRCRLRERRQKCFDPFFLNCRTGCKSHAETQFWRLRLWV